MSGAERQITDYIKNEDQLFKYYKYFQDKLGVARMLWTCLTKSTLNTPDPPRVYKAQLCA